MHGVCNRPCARSSRTHRISVSTVRATELKSCALRHLRFRVRTAQQAISIYLSLLFTRSIRIISVGKNRFFLFRTHRVPGDVIRLVFPSKRSFSVSPRPLARCSVTQRDGSISATFRLVLARQLDVKHPGADRATDVRGAGIGTGAVIFVYYYFSRHRREEFLPKAIRRLWTLARDRTLTPHVRGRVGLESDTHGQRKSHGAFFPF